MATYTLIVKNNSNLEGDICVYQANPDLANANVMSLAWFAQHVHPTTIATFQWTTDYSFIWEETAPLAPEITCKVSQVWPADQATRNSVTLTYKNGAFTFADLGAGNEASLHIHQDSTIPLKAANVGIGMAGAPVFALQSMPNIDLMFTPQPAYWVTFGEYAQGQVLNTTEITNAVKIDFPPNVFAMEATLQPDNTWVVTPAQK